VPAITLRSLLAEKIVHERDVGVTLHGTAARVTDTQGGVELIRGGQASFPASWPGGGLTTLAMTQEFVSCLDWETERAFERGIAQGLVGACGGRVTDVSSWEHLPPLVPSLFSGYGRAKLLFCHPMTASQLLLAAIQDPARNWLTPATTQGYTRYAGVELFPSIYFPVDTLVFVQDGCEVGRSFIRDSGLGQHVGRVLAIETDGVGAWVEVDSGTQAMRWLLRRERERPIRVGDILTVGDVEGIEPPMRAGLLLNSSALAGVRLLQPPPKPMSRYWWLRNHPGFGNPLEREPHPPSKRPSVWSMLRKNPFKDNP
jgi:hypothetical protein